ncbi:MAG: VapC toxin family PIN domain ribonuclease [Chloroflexi bacterium]|nr:MAG: VapC toxin family PIN domain ribonuclease [Chloroflexota bacterium]
MILIDTSAILSILDRNDAFHLSAAKTWGEILAKDEAIFLNNYILLEATALIQRRYGVETLNEFHFGMVPLLEIEWMDMSKHMQAMELLLSANRRNLSLVDISAFATMHRLGISKAFTFDRHFAEEGFEVLG